MLQGFANLLERIFTRAENLYLKIAELQAKRENIAASSCNAS